MRNLCQQAFPYWLELLGEHTEVFLALYAPEFDMALQVQPSECWDAFPLFQLLNDHLRGDRKNSGLPFHFVFDLLQHTYALTHP